MKNERNIPPLGPSSTFYYSSFIFHLSFLIVLCGCQGGGWLNTGGEVINNLADTVYAGENRQVLLTDLTGGYYFDDAFRESDLGEYGYSVWGWRLVAGWNLLDLNNSPLDEEPQLTLVRTGEVERRYSSGVAEWVELPPELPGMLVTMKCRAHQGLVFRPCFDIRRFDREEAPEYELFTGSPKREIAVARRDRAGGWVGVAWSSKWKFIAAAGERRVLHPRGDLTGRVGVTHEYQAGEFTAGSGGDIAFGWGASAESAIAIAREILTKQKAWRAARRDWVQRTLEPVKLECEDRNAMRAFARARLTLAGMIATRPVISLTVKDVDSSDIRTFALSKAHTFVLTGVPYSPFPDGWFTMFSLPGIAAMEGTPEQTLKLIPTILAWQNTDTASTKFGMLPGRIDHEGAEYRVPMISGLAAMGYERLKNRLVPRDTTLEDNLTIAAVRELFGVVKHHLTYGMAVNDADEHFLWDSPAAPPREGVLIESQVLFAKMREFLRYNKRLEEIVPGIPASLLEDKPSGRSLTAYKIRGPKKFIDDAISRLGLEHYVADTVGVYPEPLSTQEIMESFKGLGNPLEADRLPLYLQDGIPVPDFFAPDTILRVSGFLAKYWQYSNDKKHLGRMLEDYRTAGMISDRGVLSLEPGATDYQPVHEYHLDEAPQGTTSRGDVLLWSAGALGDIYIVQEAWGALQALIQNLTLRLQTTGVVGGLSEAENAEPYPDQSNGTGSPVFAASLAEFVRLYVEGLIGIVPEPGRLVRFRPRMPEDWGNFRVEFRYLDGTIRIERRSPTHWILGEEGIEPDVRLVLDIIPAPDERAQTSLRLVPGDELKVTFTTINEGVWKAEVEGY
jgi:hypothetical protein